MFNLGFLSPFWLWLGIPVAAGLIYAYLKLGKANKVIVSSTIILKKLRRRSSAKKKIRLPFRFFYELLLLSLLLLALAGFYWTKPSQNVLILLDNSLSTSAVDKSIASDSLFSLYKEHVKKIITAGGNKYKICYTSPAYTCLSSEFILAKNLVSDLNQVENVIAEDNLSQNINTAAATKDLNKLIVFTDYNIKSDNPNLEVISNRDKVLNNIAIKNVVDHDSYVSVEVISFSAATFHGKLSIKYLDLINKELKQVGNKVEELRLSPYQTKKLKVNKNDKARIINFHLKADSLTDSVDAIKLDNFYWHLDKAQAGQEVLLVSDDLSNLNEIQKILPNKILTVSPKDYQEIRNFDPYQMIIYRNFIPKNFPKINHLILAANATSDAVNLNLVDNPQITKWNVQHQILKYLSPQSLKFKKVWLAKLEPWYQDLIATNQGSLLALSEHKGVKGVYVGFPVLPFSGKSNKPLSILTLNILKFLQTESKINLSFDTDRDQQSFYYDLTGTSLLSSKHYPGNVKFPSLIYEDQSNLLEALNFFDLKESNLSRIQQSQAPELNSHEQNLSSSLSDNFQLAVLIVLIMYLASFFIWRQSI